MTTLESVLLMLLVADAIALTVLILMQQGRGADVGAAFGSGSSNTMFGSSGGGSFFTKLIVWLAIGFFVIAFGLAFTAKQRATVDLDVGVPQVIPAEEAPAEDELPLQLTPEGDSVDSDLPDV